MRVRVSKWKSEAEKMGALGEDPLRVRERNAQKNAETCRRGCSLIGRKKRSEIRLEATNSLGNLASPPSATRPRSKLLYFSRRPHLAQKRLWVPSRRWRGLVK